MVTNVLLLTSEERELRHSFGIADWLDDEADSVLLGGGDLAQSKILQGRGVIELHGRTGDVGEAGTLLASK